QEIGWLKNANIASALFVPIAIGLAFLITKVSRKYLHKKLAGNERPPEVSTTSESSITPDRTV
ncbi:MAG TPA: hypothetical protein PLO50_08875, partial [Nitrospira sp.]|nr:hypothetical protein [Nitrospira sp.]